MAQMSWRPSDELYARVRAAAAARGWSVNEYVSRVLDAATDPATAGSERTALAERLQRAGLLDPPGGTRRRPSRAAVRTARRAAGSGTPLSDLVGADRE